MKYLLSIVFLLTICTGFGQTDFVNPDIQTILKLQDQRAPASTLLPYLESENISIRLKAIQAFASLQQPASQPFILSFLSDPDSSIRSMTAYALGQCGDSLTVAPLIVALENETVLSCRQNLAEATGKLIRPGQLATLSDSLRSRFPNDYPWIVKRFATRFPVNNDLLDHIFQHLTQVESVDRQQALLYALARGYRQNLPSSYKPGQFQPYLTSPDPDIQKYSATLIGRCVQPEASEILITHAQSASDPGLLVATMRSLAQRTGSLPETFPDLIGRLSTFSTGWVQVATAQTLRQVKPESLSPSTKERLLIVLRDRRAQFTSPPSYRDAEWLLTLFQFDGSDTSGLSLLQNHPNEVIRSLYPVALRSVFEENAFEELKSLTDSPVIAVRTQAATEISTLAGSKKIPKDILTPVIKSWLEGKDQSLVTLAAGFSGNEDTRIPGMERWLVSAFNDMNPDQHLEAMQALVEGIGQIPGPFTDSVLVELTAHPSAVLAMAASQWCMKRQIKIPRLPGFQSAPDAHTRFRPSALNKPVYLEFTTNKGVFRLLTLPDQAPFTVNQLTGLAESGFYNGLLFHRLVPDFVIQGGDPRGDGWGGPDFTMRSEFGPATYSKAGMVGVASSGKDTEGSQFFIIHSPTPHLDGRYTIWAEVVSGMAVVQELEPGDRILSVRIIRG